MGSLSTNLIMLGPSLKKRISGPNALPITQLVALGERASERVQESFNDFLRQRISALEDLLPALLQKNRDDAAWRSFFTIVRDLRGSSALAQNKGANTFCKSFEVLLLEREAADPRMPEAIRSHISALSLVANGRAGDEQSQEVLSLHLTRAVDALPVILPRASV